MKSSGSSGMGIKKHRKSGRTSNSPKFKMTREMEIRKKELEEMRLKKLREPEFASSIQELFGR